MSHQAPCDTYKKRNYICKTGHNCYWLWVFTPSIHSSTSVERLTVEKVRENLFHDYPVRWGREGRREGGGGKGGRRGGGRGRGTVWRWNVKDV